MLRKVHLYGHLKKKFGAVFEFDVRTAGEALRALNATFPHEFAMTLKEGAYQIIRGRRHGGKHLDLEQTCKFSLGNADLHIVPVAAGRKKGKGVGLAIVGAALVGAAIFFSGGTMAAPLAQLSHAAFAGITYGNIAFVGAGLMLAGAASLLSSATTTDEEKNQSFPLSGPINTDEQGAPIPLIYGRTMVGGTPISMGLDIEQIGQWQDNGGSLGGRTGRGLEGSDA